MKIFGLFDPDWVWTLAPLIAWTWSTGGSGVKPVRRLGSAGAVSVYAYGFGVSLGLCALAFMLIVVVSSLGYGKKYKEKLKTFYWLFLSFMGFLYGVMLFPLAIESGRWIILLIGSLEFGLLFPVLTFFSQELNIPNWKWVEITIGLSIGLTAAGLIHV